MQQVGVKFCVCNVAARKMWYKIKSGLTLRAEHGPAGVQSTLLSQVLGSKRRKRTLEKTT